MLSHDGSARGSEVSWLSHECLSLGLCLGLSQFLAVVFALYPFDRRVVATGHGVIKLELGDSGRFVVEEPFAGVVAGNTCVTST